MSKNGKEYELFVARLQQALLEAEHTCNQKNIRVETNKKIIDNCGIERQFDVYWEYELGGFFYKTVIECKDYNSAISVEKIDALIGKTKDIPELKAVFATKTGYQSGAKEKADRNKIDLLIVREQNDSDWVDPDGTPLIKTIGINIHFIPPAHVIAFEIKLDKEWIEENPDTNIIQPFSVSANNNELFIDDVNLGQKYSLLDLQKKLLANDRQVSDVYEKIENFDNAYIIFDTQRLKILSYRIRYSIPEPIIISDEIDFSKELIGVIEYLNKNTKKTFFKNGEIR